MVLYLSSVDQLIVLHIILLVTAYALFLPASRPRFTVYSKATTCVCAAPQGSRQGSLECPAGLLQSCRNTLSTADTSCTARRLGWLVTCLVFDNCNSPYQRRPPGIAIHPVATELASTVLLHAGG